MIEESRGPPYGILLMVVVALVFVIPSIISDQAEALTEFISELSPMGLLILPIGLLLLIQFLSSGQRSVVSAVFPTGRQDDIHRASGSPFGVALLLILVLFLLYNRFSLFGGDDDSDE